MKKFKILTLFLCITMLIFLGSCKKEKKDLCENGHTWIEATCEKPKVCSVCKITDGNPKEHNWVISNNGFLKICEYCKKSESTGKQETFADLDTAMEVINTSSFTMTSTQDMSIAIAGEKVNIKMATTTNFDGNNMYMDFLTQITGEDTKVATYIKQIDENYQVYTKTGETWEYIETITADEYNNEYVSGETQINATEDMFTLTNGVWVGDTKKLTAALTDYIQKINESMGGTDSVRNCKITKYNITLENGNIKKLELTLSMTITIDSYQAYLDMEMIALYSNIGSTKVKEPSKLPNPTID